MFLGIDLGTGSVKATVIDDSGRKVRCASRSYEMLSPKPGHKEIWPETWWEKTVEAVRECSADHTGEIAGIGLSGQAHGFVLTGADDEVLRPAILWPDVRTGREIAEVQAMPQSVLDPLCNPVTTGMMGPGLMWVRRNEAEVYAASRTSLSPKDWLKLRLTGRVMTEPSDASMTCLYDMERDCWSDELLGHLQLDADMLPEVAASTEAVGPLQASAAKALGIPCGIPVSGGLADTAACLLGMGVKDPGDTVLQIGSGLQIMSVVDRITPQKQPFYNTFRGAGEGIYKMAAMQNGGTAFEWIRRVLNADWDEMYAAAFEPDPGNGGIVFLPYASGERSPIIDPDATASFTYMRLGSSRENTIRAVFEGVALAIRDSWEALAKTGVATEEMLLTGGGSRDPRWRQLVADVVRVPLRLANEQANATTGAAFLGGIAAGHWKTMADLPKWDNSSALVRPADEDNYAAPLAQFRETYRGLKGVPPSKVSHSSAQG